MAASLMDQVGELWESRLAADADAIFSACCSPAERIRLERVELDLGTIPESMFAELFPARFRAALEAEIRKQLSDSSSASRRTRDVAPAERSVLELIGYTLLHGILPWWASTNLELDPERELTEALRRTPSAVAALVQKIGRHARVRFRLVRWLADPEIVGLIRAVARSDADFILNYAADLDQRQREESIIPAGSEEFRHAKWEVILAHLLADRGSRFNAKSFLQQTLRDLAARFSFEYTDLITQLAGLATRLPLGWRDASLPQLLVELHAEHTVEQSKLAARDGSGVGDETNVSSSENASVVDHWLTRWGEILGESPARWTTERIRGLAFWKALPDAMASEVTRRLLERQGSTTRFAQLLLRFQAEDRAAWRSALRRTESRPRPPGDSTTSRSNEPLSAAMERIAESVSRDVSTDEAIAEGGTELAMPALRWLLETGALPAAPWAAGWHERSDAWLCLILAQHADSVPPLLRTWARSGRLTATMAAQLSDPALTAIVETVEPAHADDVVDFVHAAERENALRPLAPGMQGAEAFRKSVWQMTLDYLLSDRGSVFNTRSFLEHNIAQLAARHQADVATVVAFMAQAARASHCPALHRDLRELEARRIGADTPPTAEQESAAPFLFTAENIRRSPVVRLRLLRLLLNGEASRFEALLPLLWEQLLSADRREPWREFMLRNTWDNRAAETIQATGGERVLQAVFFDGAGGQAEAWQEEMSWLENSAAAAALFPGGRSGLRVRLWSTVAELWREGGGRPFSDLTLLLVRALARLGGVGVTTGASLAEREHESYAVLTAALARDGSGAATRISARLHDPELAEKFVAPPGRPAPATPSTPSREALVTRAGRMGLAGRKGPPGSREPGAAATPPSHRRAVEAGNEDELSDENETPPDPFEPIAVTNAGLVLLAPFFPELHKRCGLLDGRLFTDFKAAHRAVHLLQYLVTEGARTHEYSLVLNKVLCGLEPDAAVVTHEQLTDEEKAATAALLDGAIRRWPRAAIVTADGLRSSYLRRPGKLQRKENGWLLTVEKRGWDILLPDLPWSFPGLRPAWMPLPLEVNWI